MALTASVSLHAAVSTVSCSFQHKTGPALDELGSTAGAALTRILLFYRSISTACFATNNAISKTSPTLRSFIREVREARAELDAVLAELHSLDGVLDILKDDASSFPEALAKRTPPLLEHCTSIVHQIEGYMHVCNGLGLSARDKKYRWMAIRGDMEKLRLTLEGYKSTLAVVTDLVGLCVPSICLQTIGCAGLTIDVCLYTCRTKTKRDNDRLSIDSDASGYRDTLERQASVNDDIKSDLTRVMGNMGGLRARLQAEFGSIYAVSDIEKYLDAMQLQATNLGYRLEAERLEARPPPRQAHAHQARGAGDREDRHTHSGSSSVGDAPDSAIDMNDGPPSPYRRHFKDDPDSTPDRRLRHDKSLPSLPRLPIVEIDEFIDEIDGLGDLPEPSSSSAAARAATPPLPPKAIGRSNSMVRVSTLSPWTGHIPGLSRPSSVRSVSDYGVLDSEGNPVVPRRMSSLRSLPRSDGDAMSTVGSLRGIRPPRSESSFSMYSSAGTVTTTIVGGPRAQDPHPSMSSRSNKTNNTNNDNSNSSNNNSQTGRRLFGRRSSFSIPGLPTRPGTTSNATGSGSGKAHILSALAGPGNALALPAARADATSYSHSPPAPPSPPAPRVHHRASPSVDTTLTNATSTSKGLRPSTAVSSTGASIRSNSSRLSSMFRRVSVWSPRITADAAPEEPEPDDIFGVSLKKSMQMATATVKTHHDGSKGSSRRDFPRCILSCVSFIKENGGIHAPHIFGGEMAGGESMVRVASLKEGFSTAPYYGEGNIDWASYDVYDAAELIVLFLQQLPKPLVTEAVAKRWIVLSKQATVPNHLRLDHCIDFWDEALLGIRGAARSLFKLLLNLWGDVADAAEANEMTAERLAARMLNPLMHLPAGKYTTDFMLGLAFLIRKRSEYSVMLRTGGKSKAAF